MISRWRRGIKRKMLLLPEISYCSPIFYFIFKAAGSVWHPE